jgi:hypothetical protein
MPCTADVREQHKRLCDDLIDLSEVQHADAINPRTDPSGRWTTEVVLEPGVDVATADVLDVVSDHGMGIATPMLVRGQPPHISIQVRRDLGESY